MKQKLLSVRIGNPHSLWGEVKFNPQDQEYLSSPDMPGDCARAVIASLLDLSISAVPHFLHLANRTAEGFYHRIEEFLESHGYAMAWHATPMYHLHEGIDVYHYISGPSPRGGGLFHAVVGLNGNVVHDPHPSREGLLGNPNDWKYSFLVKIK